MNRKPLKTQFQLAFTFIILCSVVATVITYGLAIMLYMRVENKLVYPGNYYEKHLPAIERYIKQEKSALLDPSARQALEAVIPGEGIYYQVVDGDARKIYGTLEGVKVPDREALYKLFNKTSRMQGRFVVTVPIIESGSVIKGAVMMSYELQPTYVQKSGNWWLRIIFIAALLSPFIYIILFTLLFSRLFTNNINKPLRLLMEAARKIKEKDLDFEIGYHADNELGRLCGAFEEMKAELQQSLSAQWRMEQERVEMVEALAHDLKAPLSIIRGYAEALMDSEAEKDGRLQRYLGVICENADKSSELVRQMQYTSDLERKGSVLQAQPFELAPFLERKMKAYELEAGRKGIAMMLRMDAAAGGSLYTDTDLLERILDNVVMNSLEYTPDGGVISLSVKTEGERISYEISDTGPGFSRRDLEKAMQKFYRGDDARGSRDGHSGLGLYIAGQLAAKLGGSIRLSNAPAGGACVKVEHTGVI
ncbi:HAMP domain-containing sensor histidine kinase [Paenibacillus sp. HW567]|uniref:HAMP domain-containing sensor histidine kinase n=1 Tax=Paenibacillus sp. HW567 TaxID=1034769 RepID=UPI0003793A31|nr:HAMP domain-containing sensor histidine kinase [Paenibacillus sp. HW567]